MRTRGSAKGSAGSLVLRYSAQVGQVVCRDTPQGYAMSFPGGLELEVCVNTSHAYARWRLSGGKLLVSATWGHA